MQDFYSLIPLLKPERRRIIPFFIPFAGCRKRCIFCAQTLQTGQPCVTDTEKELKQAEARLQKSLEALTPDGKQEEIAFFGGTFTLLPPAWQRRFLALGRAYAGFAGRNSLLRCSTRPDAVSPAQLALLREYGLKTIELGIQSFDADALAESNRGYAPQEADAACERVIRTGFDLVIQLLPGMPGQSSAAFRQDIRRVLAIRPRAVRLYPCLVIAGTELEGVWQSGKYQPWSLEQTVDLLADALLTLNRAGIPVIRLGLAPEGSLLPDIAAGPWHPALGNLVQGEALYRWLYARLHTLPPGRIRLFLPQWLQGLFWGYGGRLAPAYRQIGIGREQVRFWEWPVVKISLAGYS